MVAMVIDHIGFVFFPTNLVLRMIGRLALPIFASALATGYYHTSHVPRYLGRILITGLLAQIPFMLLFGSYELNILFTLAAALLGLKFIGQKKYVYLAALLLLTTVIPLEYSYYGVLMVFIFHLLKNNPVLIIAAQLFLTMDYTLDTYSYLQIFSMLGVLLVLYYPLGRAPIRLPRYFFYWFYPVHLAVFLVIKDLVDFFQK